MNQEEKNSLWNLLEDWREAPIREDFTARVVAEARSKGKPSSVLAFLPDSRQFRPLLAAAACLSIAFVSMALWNHDSDIKHSSALQEPSTIKDVDDSTHSTTIDYPVSSSLDSLEAADLDMLLFLGAGG